jgi:predicted Zn-dependent protease
LPKAEEELRRITREQPRFRPAWDTLADLLLRQGKQQEVLDLAGRLERDALAGGLGRVLRGRVALARGQHAAARRELERAAADFPEDEDAQRALCRFLFEQVDVAEAEGPLLRLLRCAPRDAAAHHNLGTVYRQTGRAGRAVEAYRESLRLRPGSAATHAELGHSLHACGRTDEAVAAWKEALRLEPADRAVRDLVDRHSRGSARRA